MVLQLEDCVDCCTVLYPEHDVLFMLDHSCGHDRQRQGGLNVENMNKSFGGNRGFWVLTLDNSSQEMCKKCPLSAPTLAVFGCPVMSGRSAIMISF